MKLLEDIINELVDSSISLTSPLLKTKVLASRINNDKLLTWVNSELNGYPDQKKTPEYRISRSSVYGCFLSGNTKLSNVPIPTLDIEEDYVNFFNKIHLAQGVQSLEMMQNGGGVKYSIPVEFYGILAKELEKNGYRFVSLVSAEIKPSLTGISEALSTIRNRLLEFMLSLEKEFGREVNIEDLKNKNKLVTTMVTNYINNSGDGNVINAGDNNKIDASIKIKSRDKKYLEQTLKNNNVSESDINDLLLVIDEEEPNYEKQTFGEKVNDWIKRMMSKSMSGIWTVTLGAAGNLLSNAIWIYYIGEQIK